jgi:hypothetical protein
MHSQALILLSQSFLQSSPDPAKAWVEKLPLFGVKEPIVAQVKALRVEDVAEHTFMR